MKKQNLHAMDVLEMGSIELISTNGGYAPDPNKPIIKDLQDIINEILNPQFPDRIIFY